MAILVSKVNTLTGHKDSIYTIEGSGAKNIFFSAGGDGLVAQWDLADPENGRLLAKVPSSVYALHYLKGTDTLVVGQNYEGIHLINITSRKEFASLKITDAAIFDIISVKDKLIVCTGDGKVYLVQQPDLKIVKSLKVSDKSARTADYNPFTDELVVGYSDNFIRVFDFHSFTLKKEIAAHKISVFSVKFSPDFKFLISGSRDAHMKIWDVEQGYVLYRSIVAHMYAINDIDYSPDGKYIATCSMDKSIKVWDAHQFRLLKVIDKARHAGHGTSVNMLLWTDFSQQLLSCSDDRSISVWEIKED